MTPVHPDHSGELATFVGCSTGQPELARDPVNRSMIRHWVEAMGDHNPVYVSDEAAQAAGLDGVIAPPTMLQAWTMRGLRATQALQYRSRGQGDNEAVVDRMMALLDDEGLTSVVATNCEQHYERPLRLGEVVISSSVVEAISDLKETALGTGRFVTTRTDYVAVDESLVPGVGGIVGDKTWDAIHTVEPVSLAAKGEPVGSMLFRILKFRPRAAERKGGVQPEAEAATAATAAKTAKERPARPRPALTQDNAFFFAGARRGALLIQRCGACGTLRHTPLPACGVCQSLEWDTVKATGRGTIYSFVVVHYPQVPSFDYPLPIALVELEEGTRLVANVDDVEPSELRIGMPVEASFVAFDDQLTLPVFHPEQNLSEQNLSEQNLSEQNLSEQNLSEQNLSEQNLSEQNLSEQNLSEQNLSEQNLSEQNLSEQNLSEQNLSEQNLSEQNLSEQNLSEQNLSEQNLSEQNLSEQNLSEQNLSEQNLSEQNLSEQNLSEQNLSEQNLSEQNLSEQNLSEQNLSEQNLSEQNLSEQNLSEQNLSEQNLSEQNLSEQNLSEQNLSEQNLSEQNLSEQNLSEQNLSEQNLSEQNLSEQNLSEQNLSEQNLSEQNLSEQNLSEQNLSEQNLSEQNLSEQNLSEQNLSEQNLSEQNLSEQNLSEQNLSEQNLSEQNLSEQNLSEQNLSEQNLSEQNLSEQNLSEQNLSEGKS